ncbi:hypothetical protein [Achromobacter xylosoxidans]|uniref:hypothetical protein n=1 Tax=Alcaligenes xylosoxydans xylosoxydans TaxID=85698 RepID=UPI0011B0B0F7|nr:hypothetical protein [Achromobacter xylosoxidans]
MSCRLRRLKEASTVVLALAAAGATSGLLIALAMAGAYAWGRESTGPEGPAAWVQAAGSILAIIVTGGIAVGTVWHGASRSRKEREADELALLRSCAGLAEDAANAHRRLAAKINGRVAGEDGSDAGLGRLRSVDQSILVMLAKGIPPGALTELLAIRRELAITIEDVELLKRHPNRGGDFRKNALTNAVRRTEVIESSHENLKAMEFD